jgi:hypothetical protein
VNLAVELARVEADARAYGLVSIDLATLERLLHRDRAFRMQRDLLVDGIAVADLTE